VASKRSRSVKISEELWRKLRVVALVKERPISALLNDLLVPWLAREYPRAKRMLPPDSAT
jgi:hypothetical protein